MRLFFNKCLYVCVSMALILFLGCKKEPAVLKAYETASPALSGGGASKANLPLEPHQPGWTDDNRRGFVKLNGIKVRNSLAEVFDAYSTRKVSWTYENGGHMEEGEIIRSVGTQKLGAQSTYREVRLKNALITRRESCSSCIPNQKVNNYRAELRYFQNAEGKIFDIKTVFGHDPGGKYEFGGKYYKIENPHYDPDKIKLKKEISAGTQYGKRLSIGSFNDKNNFEKPGFDRRNSYQTSETRQKNEPPVVVGAGKSQSNWGREGKF